jgi:hypothetical protein
MTTDPPVPPVTEAMREEARRRPGGWVYAIDPAFDPDGAVPPHGVIGAWKVSERGEITGDFEHNPNYQPSPKALGFPPPTDPLDEAAQLAATGHGGEPRLIGLLLDRDVYVSDLGAGVIHVVDDDRGPKVLVFTSEEHITPETAGVQRLPGRDLAARVTPECDIEINPAGLVPVRVSGAAVAARLRGSTPGD